MTRRRIYLHVGCRKSGTSFLQKSIWDGQTRLEAEGLGFPLVGRGEHVQTLLDPLSAVQPGGQVPPKAVRAMRKLRARIEETHADKVLLTLEDLAQLPRHQIEPLMEALDGDEVHVVITARSWAKQIPSEWQQRLKERYTVPYLDFARTVREGSSPDAAFFRARHDVPDVAGRWGAQLPPEHVHVVAVPPSSSDPTVLFRLFASVVEVDPDAFVMPQVGRNPSLGYAQAETLRRINVALGDRLTDIRGEYRYVVRMYLATRVLAKQSGDKIPLPPELVGWCHETSASAAKRLVDAGYDVVGALDDLVSTPDPARAEPVPALSEADIAETAVTALAEVACLRDRERRQAQAGTPPTAHPAVGHPLVTETLARARRAVAAFRR